MTEGNPLVVNHDRIPAQIYPGQFDIFGGSGRVRHDTVGLDTRQDQEALLSVEIENRRRVRHAKERLDQSLTDTDRHGDEFRTFLRGGKHNLRSITSPGGALNRRKLL